MNKPLPLQSIYDELTELPNRELLLDRINQGIVKLEQSESLLAILFLDLDKFKNINDQFGQNIGDELLKTVAVCLSASTRGSDTVARDEKDKFIVLLPEINSKRDAELVADKIIEGLNSINNIQEYSLRISVSIGIAVFPTDGFNVADLVQNADKAMRAAKKLGGNCYRFYAP